MEWNVRNFQTLIYAYAMFINARWVIANFLLLNSEKTEVVVFGPKHFPNRLSSHLLTLHGSTLAFSVVVRNLGVTWLGLVL